MYYPPERILDMLNWQRGRCYLCGSDMGVPRCIVPAFKKNGHSKGPDKDTATVDHVRPRRDGVSFPGNRALACSKCNSLKHERQPTACERMFGYLMAECLWNSIPEKYRKRIQRATHWYRVQQGAELR